jgi:hypothetical protein
MDFRRVIRQQTQTPATNQLLQTNDQQNTNTPAANQPPAKQELEAERAEVQEALRRRDPSAAGDRDGDDAPAGGTVTVDLGASPGDCSIDSEGTTSNSKPSLQGGGSGASPSTGLEESL